MVFELAPFLVDAGEASEGRYGCNIGLGAKYELVDGFGRVGTALGGDVVEISCMTDRVLPVSTGHVCVEQ